MQTVETVQEQIDKYTSLSVEIEHSINENNIDKAKTLLKEYAAEIQNSKTYSFQAIIHFQEGNPEEAINVLENGVKEHPFNFSLHFNLAFIYGVTQKFEESFENYIYAIKYSVTNEERENALKGFQEVSKLAMEEKVYTTSFIQKRMKELEKILNQHDERVYPVNINGVSMIRKPQHQGTPNEYMVNMYKTYGIEDVDLKTRMLFKSELVKGNTLKGEREWSTKGPVVIPISKTNDSKDVHIKVNEKKYTLTKDHLPINQYNYIRISDEGRIIISADEEIFVGHPIELEPKEKPVKLVLKIFVDGLSYQFLEDVGLEEAMPNTYHFFKEGMITTNCQTTNEWTYPSKAGINTGKYSNYHKMLQPEYPYTLSESHKMLAEYFKNEGYYCANISGNWRTTPSFGYYRGYDRMIYQNFMGAFGAKEILMEAIEHLSSFSHTNNFLTLSLLDLHNVADEIENHLYSQVHTDMTEKINEKKRGTTSVQTKFDKNKVSKYLQEIKRIDNLLEVLYNFLLNNYKMDDIVIILHSDHGQSFLSDTFNLLGDQRVRVPFMVRGKDIKPDITDELMETIDIFPTILHQSKLDIPNDINGRLPVSFGGKEEREFTFSQIIHPNQTYKVRIKEKGISYYLETKHNVFPDLTVNMKGFTSKIVDHFTEKDITDKWVSKKHQYDQYVFNHMKNMLRWEE
ncbi:sulfatase-like hydrolase/transferase [Pseudogracilibacillus auburnensis]|uniref:Arylsulfatase A-like enzyme n=1 Tax=Pseudogracilibacillus auburnensis TaxID=1494959 RepID=A0A2V3W212_9BACI|nr:sulfatase-like hydrolase/transferase [Pseudogracilibacillus auburnensis]PXW88112.1 arylsulfatase A-like enzyme [Pseudogracilibacillus auburnensis]